MVRVPLAPYIPAVQVVAFAFVAIGGIGGCSFSGQLGGSSIDCMKGCVLIEITPESTLLITPPVEPYVFCEGITPDKLVAPVPAIDVASEVNE